MTLDDSPRFVCKGCGGESPTGIGYVQLHPGPLPRPVAACPNPHAHAPASVLHPSPNDPPAPDGRVFAARVSVHPDGGEYVIRWAGANRAAGSGGTRAAEHAAARHGLTLSPWRPYDRAGTLVCAGYALDWSRCPA